MWSKTKGKDLVISDVAKMEQESYKIEAVSQQQQQGRWTTWEGMANGSAMGIDMWGIPPGKVELYDQGHGRHRLRLPVLTWDCFFLFLIYYQ